MLRFSTLGRLTKDAETIKTENGVIIKMSIASDDFVKTETHTSFVDVSYFTKNSNVVNYLKKGKLIYTCGKISIAGKYINFYATEINLL